MQLNDIKEKIKLVCLDAAHYYEVELIDLQIQRRNKLLFIELIADRPDGGITIDECTRINKRIDNELESKGLIEGNYVLEVNSPGLDRPLCNKKDFFRALNRLVKFHLREETEGKLEWDGQIIKAMENEVLIKTKTQEFLISYSNISKATQIIEF